MKKKSRKPNTTPNSIADLVDKNRLKAQGITTDPNEVDVEPIAGDDFTGGKEDLPNTTGACGHWPTIS